VYRKLALMLCLLLLFPALAMAQETATEPKTSEPKELSGMSIVGNDEAPKSLYIVPWKSSELGGETSLNRMLNEADVPVDRDVFMRQLEFYEISSAQASSPQQALGAQK